MATSLALCVVEVTETVEGQYSWSSLRVFSPTGGSASISMLKLPLPLLFRVQAALRGPSCAKVRAESEIFPVPRAVVTFMVPMLLTYEEMSSILVSAVSTEAGMTATKTDARPTYDADHDEDDAEIAGERRANCY